MTLLDDLKKKLRERENKIHSLKYILHHATHCPYRYIFLSDKYFDPLSTDQVKKFLESDMTDRKQYKNELWNCTIPEDTAWGLGLFFADGSCGLCKGKNYGSAWWNITNSNRAYLEKAKRLFEKEWPDFVFKIVSYPSEEKGMKTNLGIRRSKLFRLHVNPRERHNDGRRGSFIEKWRNTFYDKKKMKKVPAALWESSRHAKLSFLEGEIAGDGEKNGSNISIHGQSGLAGLVDCMLDVNWTFKIYKDKNNSTIAYGRRAEYIPFMMDFIMEKKIISLEELKQEFKGHAVSWAIKKLESEGYVNVSKKPSDKRKRMIKYISPMPLACDNYALRVYSNAQIYFIEKFKINPAFGLYWTRNHAKNLYYCTDGKIHFIEPQLDVETKLLSPARFVLM